MEVYKTLMLLQNHHFDGLLTGWLKILWKSELLPRLLRSGSSFSLLTEPGKPQHCSIPLLQAYLLTSCKTITNKKCYLVRAENRKDDCSPMPWRCVLTRQKGTCSFDEDGNRRGAGGDLPSGPKGRRCSRIPRMDFVPSHWMKYHCGSPALVSLLEGGGGKKMKKRQTNTLQTTG